MGNVKKTVTEEGDPSSHDDEPGGCSNFILQQKGWHTDYKHSLTNINDLAKYIPLELRQKNILREVVRRYHMRITPHYLSLIRDIADPDDPIRKQCVPSYYELYDEMYDALDPLGETKTSPTPHLVHRYPDRVLLLVTGRCFMYCRHCTRKRLWQIRTAEPNLKEIEQSLDYVRKSPSIREVIVSGGDPLILATERLDHILLSISTLKNIEVIRIGTRTPVVLPSRIDDHLCSVLGKYEKLWINVQFNHPREVNGESEQACRKLARCGIPLSNQSVLLKGINDDPQVMRELCQKLQKIRVRPYYLFQCDPVVGASHFRTPVSKGIEIIKAMRGYTSGMCIPTFVVDGLDGKGKVPLQQNCFVSKSKGMITLKGYRGDTFQYPDPQE